MTKLESDYKALNIKYKQLCESKLAEYAALAMAGLLANSLISTEDNYHYNISKWAVKQAKALLKELEKEGEG